MTHGPECLQFLDVGVAVGAADRQERTQEGVPQLFRQQQVLHPPALSLPSCRLLPKYSMIAPGPAA
jgi:hypothetical protein